MGGEGVEERGGKRWSRQIREKGRSRDKVRKSKSGKGRGEGGEGREEGVFKKKGRDEKK